MIRGRRGGKVKKRKSRVGLSPGPEWPEDDGREAQSGRRMRVELDLHWV